MPSDQADAGRWVRQAADELVRDMPGTDTLSLALELEAKAEVFDGGKEHAHAIAAELRRRAAAGVRLWSPPRPLPT